MIHRWTDGSWAKLGATPSISVLRDAILATASARHWRCSLHFFTATRATTSKAVATEAVLQSLAIVKQWAACFGARCISFCSWVIMSKRAQERGVRHPANKPDLISHFWFRCVYLCYLPDQTISNPILELHLHTSITTQRYAQRPIAVLTTWVFRRFFHQLTQEPTTLWGTLCRRTWFVSGILLPSLLMLQVLGQLDPCWNFVGAHGKHDVTDDRILDLRGSVSFLGQASFFLPWKTTANRDKLMSS